MKTREKKRIESDERNAEWRAFTPNEQLRSLALRRGNSARQVKRIQKCAEESR